jgi:hypothetical protein
MSPAKALPIAVLVASTLLTACGPMPHAGYDEPARAPAQPAQAAEAQTVFVILGEPPAEAPGDGWTPEESHGESAFERARTWVGDYDCPQGNTELTFRILAVRGRHVTALFDFHHVESGASGRYLMNGSYDADTHRVKLTPGAWLAQPRDYVSVGMSGEVSEDGSLFAGRMDHPRCGAFRLKPAR